MNPDLQRFMKKINRLENGCWIWTSNIIPNGYGTFWFCGKTVLAHRFYYESFRGPIPPNLTLDHRCRNRACVNPFHLEPESRGDNVMMGETIPAKNAAKTHCPKGHPYDQENTYRPKRGGRMCKECRRIGKSTK